MRLLDFCLCIPAYSQVHQLLLSSVSTLIACFPVFSSGLIFSLSFRQAKSPAQYLSANILGTTNKLHLRRLWLTSELSLSCCLPISKENELLPPRVLLQRFSVPLLRNAVWSRLPGISQTQTANWNKVQLQKTGNPSHLDSRQGAASEHTAMIRRKPQQRTDFFSICVYPGIMVGNLSSGRIPLYCVRKLQTVASASFDQHRDTVILHSHNLDLRCPQSEPI